MRGPDCDVLIVLNPTLDKPITDSMLDDAVPRHIDAQILTPGSAEDATALLSAAANEVARVVVVGGDGMVHLAAGALTGSNTVLGIVPAGTGNDTVRALGIPMPERNPASMRTALDIALGDPIDIDVGLVNHHPFVSVATLGFSATVNDRANRLRWPRGSAAYSAATVLELPRLRPVDATISVDGEVHELEANLIAAGNTSHFGGGMAICPDADPTDGQLDITVIGAVSRFKLLRTFPRVYSGRHVDDPRVTTLRGAEIRIETAGRVWPVWADGEPVSDTPSMLEVIKGGLRVAHPQPT